MNMLVYMLLVVVSLTWTRDVTVHAVRVRREKVTPSQKAELLEHHNILRALEDSSSMELMTWNDELETAAENWAKECNWKHSFPKPWPGGEKYGQNLWATTGRSINMTEAVQEWYAEKSGYDYDTGKCSIEMCGHYTQVVWANSRQLGCAYYHCNGLQGAGPDFSSSTYLVCNYLPAGNIRDVHPDGTVQDRKPFKKGPACSNCGSGAGWCKYKLCNKQCSGPGKDCSCAAHCYNCAKLDLGTCRCSCAKGWHGTDCSKRCKDTDKRCNANPGWPPHWCNDANYPYVNEKCPAMCELCVRDPNAVAGMCQPVYANKSHSTLIDDKATDDDDKNRCQRQQQCCTLTLLSCVILTLAVITKF